MSLNISDAENRNSFFSDFVKKTPVKKYVFGINKYARYISELAVVDGYIDEITSDDTWMGKPVLRLDQIEDDAMVVSAVTNAKPKTAINKLKNFGKFRYLDYFSFAEASGGLIPQIEPITETRSDHIKNGEKYKWIRSLLSDDESRQVFDDVIGFRLTGDLSLMDSYDYAAHKQYFEPFVEFGDFEVFVDGGGFDGFTTMEFIRHCPNYKKVHFFEPNQKTLVDARNYLVDFERIDFHCLGLFDKDATLKFDTNCGSASKISKEGDSEILVSSLDKVVTEKVTFVKLDLEGAETAALIGMKSHLATDHPKLAVAVYHHPSHFWMVPEFILGVRSDYDVYLRHYTESWTETVMYFIPR